MLHGTNSGFLLLLNQLTQSGSSDAMSSSVAFRETDLVNRTGSNRAVMPGVTKAKPTMYRTTVQKRMSLRRRNRNVGNERFLRMTKNAI